jgi:hypothetical protein
LSHCVVATKPLQRYETKTPNILGAAPSTLHVVGLNDSNIIVIASGLGHCMCK